MKYIVIFAIVVILVRIDFFINIIQRGVGKFSRGVKTEEPLRVDAGSATIPFGEDKTLKQTNVERVFSLLEAFHSNPEAAIRLKIMEELKASPKMFTTKADKNLQLRVFALRDLLIAGNSEMLTLAVEMQNFFVGENQEMIKRFFSIYIDQNMEGFLKVYGSTKDQNCSTAHYIADALEEDGKLMVYQMREESLKAYLAKEDTQATGKALAQNCLVNVLTEINKLTKPAEPVAPVPSPAVTAPTEATP